MKEITLLISLKFKLLNRVSYEKKEKIRYLWIVIVLLIPIFCVAFLSKDIVFNITSSYMLIVAVCYQSVQDTSYLRSIALHLINRDKKVYFYYNLLSELIVKMTLIIALLFTNVFTNYQSILYFLISSSLFIVLCSFLAELSRIDKLYFYVLRGLLILVLLIFLDGFYMFIHNYKPLFSYYFHEYGYKSSIINIIIQSLLTIMFYRVYRKKTYLR